MIDVMSYQHHIYAVPNPGKPRDAPQRPLRANGEPRGKFQEAESNEKQ